MVVLKVSCCGIRLERKRSESVLDRNYPVAKDHYTTMLELRDEFNAVRS